MAGKFKVRPIAGHEPVPRFIDPDDSRSLLGCVTLVGGYQDYLFFKNGAKTTILPIKVKFYMLEILLH